MSRNGETDTKSSSGPDESLSYGRFDGRSTVSTCSSIVLSSCSSDEENDDNHNIPPLKWKRQKILNNHYHNPERLPNGSDSGLNNLHIDRSFIMSAKENMTNSFDDERRVLPPRRLPPIPEDKLHRRNPHTVRQELKMLDDLIPDTTLADVHLSEMPGLQNTEQWKRIAGRAVHASPPLSRQYYQTVIATLELQDGQVPQPLGSYRRPGRSENEPDTPSIVTPPWRAPRRRILFGSSVAVIVVAIVVAVVLAVTLVQKSTQSTTDYYTGNIYVNAKFERALSDPTSILAKNYKREFCSLVGTTLADTKTKYALFYSTCNVLGFYNGSIIANFVLGFTRSQNVTRLNSFLNRTLFNKQLFGGTILSIAFNLSNENSTDYDDDDDDDGSSSSGKLTMTEQNSLNDQAVQQPSARTTYTTVTYTTHDKGLSITISETITISNNNLDKTPVTNKNYELILVPSIDNNTKTVVIPTTNTTTEKILPLPPTSTTTNVVQKSSSQHNLYRPIKTLGDTNFAYIDESSDDRTFSSGDGISTLEDLTAQDSTTSESTASLDNETLTNSASTLVNNSLQPTTSTVLNRPTSSNRPPITTNDDSSEEKRPTLPSRPYSNVMKRQRRMVIPKNQRRLLQYELMPTGKVYYVDRPHPNENRSPLKTNRDDEPNIIPIISRSSSLDTLSDKHHRHQHHQHHYQPNRKIHYHDSVFKKADQKISVGGRLASNNNLPNTSSFKPINLNNKKKRYSSFDPTPESLDRVFDVLIAADKRREEHEFWKEKFEHHPTNSRIPIVNNRIPEKTNANTIPFLRSKQTPLNSNTILNVPDNRSQSYTNKRIVSHDNPNQQTGCLLEDCLRRRTLLLQKQQQQQLLPERNYSPNTIYSTNYPKQQLLPPTGKSSINSNQQPVRILPLSNGRLSRAPQARQTSDELSTTSDVWATRSSVEDESHPSKKLLHPPTRFQSTVNRNRLTEFKPPINKRASSVEQQKTHTKNLPTTKSKFLDLFKFNR